ncbi:MAG: hypothetical protein MRJ68_16545 [Nitrospira sp.]|nr:hypothetical protein [Nitrospira sp.]
MAKQTAGAAAQQPRSRHRPKRGEMSKESEHQVCCRRCRSMVFTLCLCGPQLRGRCQGCGTVWIARWSLTQRG